MYLKENLAYSNSGHFIFRSYYEIYKGFTFILLTFDTKFSGQLLMGCATISIYITL